MKVSYFSQNPLRKKFARGETAYGLWVTLESTTVTEIAAAMGVDWICIDMEHGALDYSDVLNHLRAAKGTDLAVLTRRFQYLGGLRQLCALFVHLLKYTARL